MDCLTNLIGIDGKCSSDTPESPYFINDLPGVSIYNVESAINSEPNSAVSYLTRLKNIVAPQIILDRLRSHLKPNHEIKSAVDQDVIGLFQDNLQIQAAQAFHVGLNIKIDRQPYYALDITKIGLQLQTSGAVNVEIRDLISGTVLDTIAVTTVANVPTYVNVNKTYFTDKQKLNLFVSYDATATGGYKTNLKKGFCSSCDKPYVNGGHVSLKGAKLATGATAIDENLQSLDGTAGLTLTYSVRCAIEPFICSIKPLLYTAIWYKLGELVMQEMRAPNNRLNSVVSVYQDDYERLELDYSEKYEETLKGVLNGLSLPNTPCFKCRERVKSQVVLP